jgi:predicted permease
MKWNNFFNRLGGKPASFDEDLAEELEFHQAMTEAKLGDKAAARRAIGNRTLAIEQARDAWAFVWLRDFAMDVRYGVRALAANRTFTLATAGALTLGLGVTGVVFSIFNTLLFAPWNIRDAGSVVQVFAERGAPGRYSGFPWPEFFYMRDNARSLAGMTGFDTTGIRVRQGDTIWTAMAIVTSENYFDVLGTGFALGRGFSPSTGDYLNPAPEIVLHHDTWMTKFGGDPRVLGQWLDLNGHRLQVVGVAAQGFSGPSPRSPALWVPAPWRHIFHPEAGSFNSPNRCCSEVFARLKPGVDRKSATAELATLSARYRETIGRKPDKFLLAGPTVMANPRFFSQAAPVLIAVSVAALLVLLLACANAANLQLARAMSRRHEIAVRASLGAGTGRILRQLVTESLLLAALAGGASLLIAAWLPGYVFGSIAGDDASSLRFSIDWRVLAGILSLTIAAALLSGLAPAWTLSKGLQSSTRATQSGRLRAVLLATQVALCATLLSGSTLLVRALQEARQIQPGFAFEDVIRLDPRLDSSGANTAIAQPVLGALAERLSALPGVRSVAHTSVVPLGNSYNNTMFANPRTNAQTRVGFGDVSANYHRTLRVPLLAGRYFETADEARKDIVIIDEALAQQFWSNENPIGQKLGEATVIGVVASIRIRGLTGSEPYMYRPSRGTENSTLLIRHDGPAELVLAESVRIARGADRRVFPAAAPYRETVDKARNDAAIAASISGALSALALCLACLGIYGVAAYGVSQRIREIGVRVALGARPLDVMRLIVGQNLRSVCIGAAIGIAGAIALGRLLSGFLYGVKPTDALALVSAILLLGVVASLSTLAPARRASRVDPVIALRYE